MSLAVDEILQDRYQVMAILGEGGVEAPLLGSDVWSSPELDRGVFEGAYYTTQFSYADERPLVRDFADRYRESFGDRPDANAALAYDAATILLTAMERSGSIDDPERVALAIERGDFEGVTGPIAFDPEHNPIKPVYVLRIERGELVHFDTVMP
ncbi:MAG: ABC transporter substrate-binding protein [Anaerolineae bacterium]